MKPPLPRVPGTAVFLNRGKATAPLALRANVEHNHVRHEYVIILAIQTTPVPHVPAAQRLSVDSLGHKDDRITHVTARFGYLDQVNVPALLPLIRQADAESPLDPGVVSFFLSTIALRLGGAHGMSRWRKRLSWPPPRSPPTPPNTSSSPASAPSLWAHASSSEQLPCASGACVAESLPVPAGLAFRSVPGPVRAGGLRTAARSASDVHIPQSDGFEWLAGGDSWLGLAATVDPADALSSLLLTAGSPQRRSRRDWKPGPRGGVITWQARPARAGQTFTWLLAERFAAPALGRRAQARHTQGWPWWIAR
jgi:potassium transporter